MSCVLACAVIGPGAGADPGLVRVHQGVEDLDLLSTSFLQLEPDLRQDLGFEHLYVDPTDPERFVRVSGGLYAVSPRTDYFATRKGLIYPVVSPGTVFYIGSPPAPEADPGAAPGRELSGVAVVRTPVRAATVVSGAPLAAPASTKAGASPLAQSDDAVEAEPEAHGRADMSVPWYRAMRLREIARSLGAGGEGAGPG